MSDNEELSPSRTHSPKVSNGGKRSSYKTETPKPNVKKGGGIELTAVESLLFFNIVRYNKDTSAVDWDQVAVCSNLKNAASAKVRFRQIQKKYGMEIVTPAGGGNTSNRKRRITDEDPIDAQDDDNVVETPSTAVPQKRAAPGTGRAKKVAKKSTRKVSVVKQEHERDQNDKENEKEEQEEQRTIVAKSLGQGDSFVKQEPNFDTTHFDHSSGGPPDVSIAQGEQQHQMLNPFNAGHASHAMGQPQHHPMMQSMASTQQVTASTPQQIAKLREILQQQQQQQAAYNPQFAFFSGPQVGGGSFGLQDPPSPSPHPRHSPQALWQQNGGRGSYLGSHSGTIRPADLLVKTGSAGHAEEWQAEKRDAGIKQEE